MPTEVQSPPVMEDASKESAVEIGTEWAKPSALETVYFDTNKSELRQEARNVLKRNAGILKMILEQAPSVKIRIEGHCDERSTLEYNLALGQRRANSVRDYYAALGIKKSMITTISYGEEKPVCFEHNENCWWKNRRGDTTLRSPAGPIRVSTDNRMSEKP